MNALQKKTNEEKTEPPRVVDYLLQKEARSVSANLIKNRLADPPHRKRTRKLTAVLTEP
jgi:hypothetical protein